MRTKEWSVLLMSTVNNSSVDEVWLINWLIDWLIDWLLTDWLTDWLTNWFIDWLVDWLNDWLIDFYVIHLIIINNDLEIHKQAKTNEIKFQRFGDFVTPLSRNDLMNTVRVKKSSGARFSKVPITFRARKAILCARCLYLRLKFCWFWKLSNKILSWLNKSGC